MATQMSKSQLIEKIATSTELSKRDVKNVMDSLVDVGHKELKKNGLFLVPGFAKFVADADTGLLLGTHIIGPHAGDLIAEPTFAQVVEATAAEIGMTVHAHPTLPEVLPEAALAVDGAAIHV